MKKRFEHPLAVTMWDFSWLERRWPGAGYEEWEQNHFYMEFQQNYAQSNFKGVFE